MNPFELIEEFSMKFDFPKILEVFIDSICHSMSTSEQKRRTTLQLWTYLGSSPSEIAQKKKWQNG